MDLSPRALRSMLNVIPSGVTLDISPSGDGALKITLANDGKPVGDYVIRYCKPVSLRETLKQLLPKG